MHTPKTTALSGIDILILTLIFFGIPIASSVMMYWDLTQAQQVAPNQLSFNELANYGTMLLELLSLGVAWAYLYIRKFNFRLLNLSFNRFTLPFTLLLVVVAGFTADVYQYLHYLLLPHHFPDIPTFSDTTHYTPSLIVVSLLNGFFEEIFFMGLVFAVSRPILPYAIGLSFIVRFLFHTYQGLAGALTITTLGMVFWLFRRKTDKLLPFILAHGVFDIFGLSLLHWFA